jgi:hypothetical protein
MLLPIRVDNKCGYINLRGEIVVPCQYRSACKFAEGLAAACVHFDFDNDRHEVMVIDYNLKEVGRLTCQNWGDFSEGLMFFERDDKYGYINSRAQVAIPPSFDNAGDFVNGLAWASVQLDVTWRPGVVDQPEGFINRKGEWVVPAQYARLWPFEKGERLTAFMLANNKWGLLDREGRIMVDARFDSLGWPSGGMLSAGVRMVDHLDHGIINDRGEWLVEPRWDDCDGGFSEDLMSAAIDGNWGLVDREGEWVIKPQYTNARRFSEGLCGVYVGGQRDCDYALFGGKYGFIDKLGEMVIEPRWDIVSEFEGGVCEVQFFEGDPDRGVTRRGWIDRDGHYIWEPTR